MDTFFPTSTPAMEEELRVQNDIDYRELCRNLSNEVVKLEDANHQLIGRKAALEGLNSRYLANVNDFEDQLKDAVLNEQLDPELAQSFASIFGFDLMQEIDLEITVTFRGTAKLPLNEVAEDFDWEGELNFSCDSSWSEVDFMLEDVSHVNVEMV